MRKKKLRLLVSVLVLPLVKTTMLRAVALLLLLGPVTALVPPARFCRSSSRAVSLVVVSGAATNEDAAGSHRDENQKKPLVNRRDALAFFSLGAAIASVTQEAEPALALQDLDNVGSLGNAILQAQPAEKPSAPPPAAAPTGNKGGKAAPEPYAGGKKKMKWQMNAEETPKVKVEGQEDDAMMIAKQRRQEKREAQEEKSKARKKNCTYIEKMNGTGGC